MKKQYLQPTMTCSEFFLQSFMSTLSDGGIGIYGGTEGGTDVGGSESFTRKEDNNSWVWQNPYKGEWYNGEW